MFYSVSGSLIRLMPGVAVVEAGGVGFKLTISNNTYSSLLPLAEKKENVRLYTNLVVREDDLELFGFGTEAEVDTFKLLISVSGVGPKAAISLLSSFTPEKLVLAVCTDDRKAISKANGIGPKTAARIILELHDKLASKDSFLSPEIQHIQVSAQATPAGGKLNEAQEALLVLGYSRSEILNALNGVDTSHAELEEIIRVALKKLAR